MKIAVLNGSPKGEVSVTMQYVHFLEQRFPEAEFNFFDVALKIRKLEKDDKAFQEVIDGIAAADAVLWAFPLYFLVVCSQYKRFIELIFEKNAVSVFRGKPAASLSTSINFFDYTAHNYINAVCDDLDMNYFGAYSAEMNDLLKTGERRRLKKFGELFFKAIKDKTPAIRNNKPLSAPEVVFEAEAIQPVNPGDKKVLIVADDLTENANLQKMVERLRNTFSPAAELALLKDVDIKGGCLGCCECGFDNQCVYDGKDGFRDFFNSKIKTADILFLAGAIHDRYLSALWKCFFDRSFFNGHTPFLKGKQIGFVISGPFRDLHNLREIFDATTQFQLAGFNGFVSDDMGSSAQINAALQTMATSAVDQGTLGYIQPPTFYQVAGTKLFRDAIYGRLRPVFQADHRYYKEHGMYNFPQTYYKWRMINGILVMLTKIPAFRREFFKRIKKEMIKPTASALKRTE
ncbi:MAG: NAD(P)H-dependent oxidoreductase [Smithella sp.]|nr:NAD(P)H-dependent oxidoreductase [Smithella sp.]HQG64268.1 NAD(P)H-dependent oxidoreductase [Smithella sp.]